MVVASVPAGQQRAPHAITAQWRPLAEEADISRLRTIAALAAEHTSRVSQDGCVFALLLDVYLARALASDTHADRAITALEGIANSPTMLTRPALHGGLAGIGFVIHHATNQLSDWLDSGGTDVCDEIDTTLISAVQHYPVDGSHDLMSGLAGIALYAVERLPRPACRQLLALVIERLTVSARGVEPGIAWRTGASLVSSQHADRMASPGDYDTGVAHGVSSLIVVLARAIAAGIASDRAWYLLDGAVRWILAERAKEKVTARPVAWCHGGLGLAVALLHAARLTDRTSWESAALDLAAFEAARRDHAAASIDICLCHGAAGNAHLFNRLYYATGEPSFLEAARRWLARVIQQYDEFEFQRRQTNRHPDDFFGLESSVLRGSSGVGLALLAATAKDVPLWDRLLLADIPNPGHATGRAVTADGSSEDALHVVLKNIWEETLATDNIGPDEDLFASYGATSWHALNAITAIAERLKADIVPEELLKHPTIAAQARFLRNGDRASQRLPLRLNASESGSPLFLFPAGGGSVFVYRLLAKRINDRPIVAMQDPRLFEEKAGFATLEDLVEQWVPDLRSTWPDGPYVVGGYCLGGAFAFDFASRLSRSEQERSLVIMIDTTAPPHRASLARIARHLRVRLAIRCGLLRGLLRRSIKQAGARALLLAKFARDVPELLRAVQWAMPEVVPPRRHDLPVANEDVTLQVIRTYLRDFEPHSTLPGLSLTQVLARMHVTRHNVAAFSRYTPRRRFHGRVIMFQIRGSNRAAYWQRFVQQPIVVYDCDVPTGQRDDLRQAHAEMIFTDKNLDTFCGDLISEIQEWEQRQAPA